MYHISRLPANNISLLTLPDTVTQTSSPFPCPGDDICSRGGATNKSSAGTKFHGECHINFSPCWGNEEPFWQLTRAGTKLYGMKGPVIYESSAKSRSYFTGVMSFGQFLIYLNVLSYNILFFPSWLKMKFFLELLWLLLIFMIFWKLFLTGKSISKLFVYVAKYMYNSNRLRTFDVNFEKRILEAILICFRRIKILF